NEFEPVGLCAAASSCWTRNRAAQSVRSLSPFGERVGVRGLQNYRKLLTPHPTPLPMGEGADRICPRAGSRRMYLRASAARDEGGRRRFAHPILQVPSFGGAMISMSSFAAGTVPSAS